MAFSRLAKAVLGLLLAPAVMLTVMTFVPTDAEAGRRVIRAGTKAAVPLLRGKRGEEEQTDASAGAATAGDEGTVSADPARAATVTPATPVVASKPKEVEVPGCGPGNVCIVCMAGCTGNTDGIVSVVAKIKD